MLLYTDVMSERDYQHSRPLDVHRWSDYNEVNMFVDHVYDEYLNNQSNENQKIKLVKQVFF